MEFSVNLFLRSFISSMTDLTKSYPFVVLKSLTLYHLYILKVCGRLIWLSWRFRDNMTCSTYLLTTRIHFQHELAISTRVRWCVDDSSMCTVESCSNGGECIQEWSTFSCDCDLTTFTGPTCDEGITLHPFSRFWTTQPHDRWIDRLTD